MKTQNGITLVALVITIIVLLILAGVSISIAIGENGILSRSSDAVTAHHEAEEKEQIALMLHDYTMASYAYNYAGATVNPGTFEDFMSNKDAEGNEVDNHIPKKYSAVASTETDATENDFVVSVVRTVDNKDVTFKYDVNVKTGVIGNPVKAE